MFFSQFNTLSLKSHPVRLHDSLIVNYFLKQATILDFLQSLKSPPLAWPGMSSQVLKCQDLQDPSIPRDGIY